MSTQSKSPNNICNYDDLTDLEYIKKYPYKRDPYWIVKYYDCPKEVRSTPDDFSFYS